MKIFVITFLAYVVYGYFHNPLSLKPMCVCVCMVMVLSFVPIPLPGVGGISRRT